MRQSFSQLAYKFCAGCSPRTPIRNRLLTPAADVLMDGGKTSCKLIFCFVALESLKSTFATAQKIPFVKRCFRKISNPPKTKLQDEPCYSFEELLQNMLAAVGMHHAVLNPIVQLRNEIIHNGISQQTHAANRHVYNACQDLLREYLLRLLAYKGAFWFYAHPDSAPGKI